MKTRIVIVLLCLFGVAAFGAPADAQQRFGFELYAGYYLPEELDEDILYGARFGGPMGSGNWGWKVSTGWFDVEDSQGFSSSRVNMDLWHFDFSLDVHPGGGPFHFFFGPGFTTAELTADDGFGGNQEFSDDVFTVHGGAGWDILVGESFYIPIEARARWYELEGFGPEGGKQSQLDYEASAGLGWKF